MGFTAGRQPVLGRQPTSAVGPVTLLSSSATHVNGIFSFDKKCEIFKKIFNWSFGDLVEFFKKIIGWLV